jgi:hypothetical protein
VLSTTAHEAAGATGTRLSLRPLIFSRRRILHNSGVSRRGKAEMRPDVIASEAKRSNPFFLRVTGWFASRSLSSGAHSRDPLARNDG